MLCLSENLGSLGNIGNLENLGNLGILLSKLIKLLNFLKLLKTHFPLYLNTNHKLSLCVAQGNTL